MNSFYVKTAEQNTTFSLFNFVERPYPFQKNKRSGFQTGGEPLVRKDWFQIASRIRAHGMELRFSSNGNVKGCTALADSFSVGFVQKQPLSDILRDDASFPYTRDARIARHPEAHCASCAYGAICKAGCRAVAYDLTGSIGAKSRVSLSFAQVVTRTENPTVCVAQPAQPTQLYREPKNTEIIKHYHPQPDWYSFCLPGRLKSTQQPDATGAKQHEDLPWKPIKRNYWKSALF
ncbi:MAG: SPASM domain-containing protein [Deltaproteobacteria bacterium]|nr:SPASM domain-containing protein [Deltaproteobacteria bacterium]